ncbi:unnamed protein product [Absidia cylindrospora]
MAVRVLSYRFKTSLGTPSNPILGLPWVTLQTWLAHKYSRGGRELTHCTRPHTLPYGGASWIYRNSRHSKQQQREPQQQPCQKREYAASEPLNAIFELKFGAHTSSLHIGPQVIALITKRNLVQQSNGACDKWNNVGLLINNKSPLSDKSKRFCEHATILTWTCRINPLTSLNNIVEKRPLSLLHAYGPFFSARQHKGSKVNISLSLWITRPLQDLNLRRKSLVEVDKWIRCRIVTKTSSAYDYGRHFSYLFKDNDIKMIWVKCNTYSDLEQTWQVIRI